MNRNHFTTLLICVISGLLFSLGMCMCLLPEWNAFIPGVVLTAVGGSALLVMGIISYVKNAKNRAPINWKLVGKIAYAVVCTLVFGLGMCMILVWNLMLWGIIVGIIGIVMVLFIIPMFFGLKKQENNDISEK